MFIQFIAVVLLIALLAACGNGNQNSRQTRANESENASGISQRFGHNYVAYLRTFFYGRN